MKAIQVVDVTKNIPRYLLSKVLGSVYRPAFWGPWALPQYREVPEPTLPSPHWVKIGTRLGGICGSDMNLIRLNFNLALAHLVSFPFVLGHENVGIVVEIGEEVDGFAPGDRVVADPVLSCVTRGIKDPCEFCRRGEFPLCLNLSGGDLAPGLAVGFCRDTGGSWGEFFVAHEAQLVRVPDNVSDESALMAEPFSVSLRAAMRDLPKDGDTVLVLGAGVSGLCTVTALRTLGCGCRVIVVAKHAFQGEAARRLGADDVIYLRDADLIQAVSAATGGKLYKPVLGKRLLVGGVDMVYDCVGSKSTVDDALRLTRSRGTVVLLGMAAVLKRVDWTSIWLNELTVRGSVWGSGETFWNRRVRAMQLALEWMADGKLDFAPMVTHRFTLDDYKAAFDVTSHKGRHQVIKSAFMFH